MISGLDFLLEKTMARRIEGGKGRMNRALMAKTMGAQCGWEGTFWR